MILLLSVSIGNTRTIVLSKTGSIKTFEQAIHLVSDNDTLLIKAGDYLCINQVIDKKIVIIGEGYPKLNANNSDEVLIIKHDSVIVKGVEVCNSKAGSMKDFAGIRIFKANNIQLIENKITNCYFGIYVSDASDIILKRNKLSGSNPGKSNGANGIHLWKCERVSMINNVIKGHRDGIYLEFAKHCAVSDNFVTENYRYGLHFMFSDNDIYVNNTFKNNGTGVAVMYTKHVEMYNNVFIDNWGASSYALLLKDITHSIFKGNRLINNTVGITMEGSIDVKITENDFIKNGYAMRMMANCIEVTIKDNNFSGNTFDMTTNGEPQDNVIENNYWDKFTGYDLGKDGIGDIPYRPVSLYSQISEQMPYSLMLLRSFIVELLDKVEKGIPTLVPESLKDTSPKMKYIKR